MEAHGTDGSISLTDSHVIFEWKTLRGRLSSIDGNNFEAVPYSRVYEAILIAPQVNVKGCLQLNLIGNKTNLALEENWISALKTNKIHHTVLFAQSAHFQFHAIADQIHRRVQELRKSSPFLVDTLSPYEKFA